MKGEGAESCTVNPQSRPQLFCLESELEKLYCDHTLYRFMSSCLVRSRVSGNWQGVAVAVSVCVCV